MNVSLPNLTLHCKLRPCKDTHCVYTCTHTNTYLHHIKSKPFCSALLVTLRVLLTCGRVTFPAPPSTESLIKTHSALIISPSDTLFLLVFSWDTAPFWQGKMKQMLNRNLASETRGDHQWPFLSSGCVWFLHATSPHRYNSHGHAHVLQTPA